MLKKLTPPFVLLLLTSTAGYAAQESSLSDDIVNQALSCADLVDKIRDSDCIAPVADFLKGGNLSLGATMGAFSVNLKVKNEKTVVGKMGGENSWAPHYSINTRPRHFDGSNFGYDYSFTYEQSATTSQVITRGGKDKAIDLGTYAIGSIIATQVNLFYSIGANDDSPAKYFTLAIGVGLGYGSVKGNTYLTEDETNTVCYDAATKYHEGTGSIE
ncbi:MAG: hypothetical protein OEX00_08150, partial [Gammaproteobacteria bacterium]|nr:hypothetical protein [Gammaproteobacteria bacterium]